MVRVPLDLDHPYWVEDEHFDLEFHVRHSRLPQPADWRQLCITIARMQSRPIDLSRPAWEMHVIEGLDNVDGIPAGSFALFTKLHHSTVDGHSMRDIVSGIHDLEPEVAEPASSTRDLGTGAPARATELLRRALPTTWSAGRCEWRGPESPCSAAPRVGRALARAQR